MDSDFYVYLPSNVSPDTFPNNEPSCYSTILANEIDLVGGNWEVGVQNIIYPTHIATTSASDKIFVYEKEEYVREILKYDAAYVTVQLSMQKYKTRKAEEKDKAKHSENVAEEILTDINSGKWVEKKGVYMFEFKKSATKFVIHNRIDDLLIVPSEGLKAYLGFQENCFLNGEHWAWSKFDAKKQIKYGDDRCMLFDLTLLEKEEIKFHKSWDRSSETFLFTAEVILRFKDFKDDDLLFEPTVQLEMNFKRGEMIINVLKASPPDIKRYEIPLLLLKLDKDAPKNIKWYNHARYCLLQNDGGTLVNEKMEHLGKIDKETLAKMEAFSATVYFHKQRTVIDTYKEKPMTEVVIKTNKELKDPKDLLPSLNKFGGLHGYKFSFLEHLKRFEVEITGRYYIKLSHSLATILGFGSYAEEAACAPATYRAIKFPILDRSITTLYTYTNIVDVVHIGDVRAALLLSCPFKVSKENNVQQLEFLRPTYTKVNRQKLNQIDIEIRDGAGDLVPFLHGKTVITLHFRRRH